MLRVIERKILNNRRGIQRLLTNLRYARVINFYTGYNMIYFVKKLNK